MFEKYFTTLTSLLIFIHIQHVKHIHSLRTNCGVVAFTSPKAANKSACIAPKKMIIQQTCKKVCKKLSVLCIASAAICPRAPSPRTCNTNCAERRRRTKSKLQLGAQRRKMLAFGSWMTQTLWQGRL